MARPGMIKSASFIGLFVTLLFAVNAACFDAFAPCSSGLAGGLDGSWDATTIDGQPALNFPLPFPSSDLFRSGFIRIRTQQVHGDCDDPDRTTGTAVATYNLADAGGTAKPPKYFSGRFDYDHNNNTVKITAAGYQLDGTVSGNSMTLPASHALFGTYTLVLQRN